MRLVRIFFLFFENVFQYRGQIFIWFIVSFLHPMIYLLFWIGAGQGVASVTYYYIFFIVASGLLYVHVEVDAYEDVQQGQLSLYLMKPLSYLSVKFLDELPWRIIQGTFGMIALVLITRIMPLPPFTVTAGQLFFACLITLFAYCIMFLFKMIILLLSLWVIDIGGLMQLSEMIILVFAGFIMPIRFFPDWAAQIAYHTPFPYTLYYAVSAFQGLVGNQEAVRILTVQCLWLIIFYAVYSFLWKKGLRKFNAVGL